MAEAEPAAREAPPEDTHADADLVRVRVRVSVRVIVRARFRVMARFRVKR